MHTAVTRSGGALINSWNGRLFAQRAGLCRIRVHERIRQARRPQRPVAADVTVFAMSNADPSEKGRGKLSARFQKEWNKKEIGFAT